MGQINDPMGVVMAGGAGRRIGGAKAVVELHGRPLLSYPVGVLKAVLGEVVVVAKPDTELPSLPGLTVWLEPPEPSHPLTGIVHALEHADGRAVLVAAGDLPFLTEAFVRELASAAAHGRPVVLPRAGGRAQPLLARYEPAALPPLAAALGRPLTRLTGIVEALGPRILDADADARCFFNVNLPEDLLTATAMMDRADPGVR